MKTVLHALQGLPHCRLIVMRRNTHEQIDLADAHQLAKKIIREKTFFSQLLLAPYLRDGVRDSDKSPRHQSTKIKFDGDGTNKTGKDPKSAGMASPRCGEIGFCRTSRSECASCTSAD